MEAFKCWLIANFEIVMILLTIIIGSIAFFGFSGMKINEGKVFMQNENSLLGYVVLCFILLMTFPTNRGILQFGKYILMLGGIIYFTWFFKEHSEMTDVLEIAMYNRFITWLWIVFSVSTVISGFLAYYTFVNIDEVVSRRMLYRNSNVGLFEFSWLYTLDRFCNITVSIVTCTLGLIFLFVTMILPQN